jgi:hypothetical protein
MTTYDHAGHEVHAEDVLDREELGAYYDRRGWPWRRDDDEPEETR